jgi:two-component system sensor histidine kinase HydH
MKKQGIAFRISPLMVIGSAIVLMVVVVSLGVSSYNRQKHYMIDILMEKGSALIKSFEAGTRTGMRHMGWQRAQIQYLLEETARQTDVLYIAITDEEGRILAHSDSSRTGGHITDRGHDAPAKKANWRLTTTENGLPAFEVYRIFTPVSARGRGHMGRMGPGHMSRMRGGASSASNWWWRAPSAADLSGPIIYIGFDRTSYIEARKADLQNIAVMSIVLLVLGFAGFTSLLLLQSYHSTRQRLKDTSAIADEVVASLPIGLLVMDAEGRIIMENPAAEAIIGKSAREVRGRPAAEVLPENLAALIGPEASEQRVIEEEMPCRFSGKDPVPLSVSAARIVNEAGERVGMVMIFRDLTEIRSLQQAVQRKEKLAAIGGLAAGVAHEIRNPLSSVKGMATFFKNRFTDDPDAREAAEVMVEETNRLNRVISELLEFARPPGINAIPSDINTILEHSIRLIRQDAEGRGVRVSMNGENEMPKTPVDPDRFIQCLLNLYLNAIQAMGEGGDLHVSSRHGEKKTVVIRVADTGPGISETDENRIFDPYYTTKPSGTGLGLAIVHKIIESHGGRISVKSTPGEGTAFYIELPAAASGREEQGG